MVLKSDFKYQIYLLPAAAAAKSLQLCLTLREPIDGSLSGSSVPGILQARTLEWVAISFSNAWKWKLKVKSLSCVCLFMTPWTEAYQAPLSMGFSRQEYWSGVPLPSPIYCPQFSHSVMSDPLWPHESQHSRPPCPSSTPGVHSDSHPSSQWCHPAMSSSVVPFSSCPQSLPASESFPTSQLFAWGGQSTGVSALASFLPKKSQGWSSEWTGWISLQSKGLSRVFSSTTVQKHQFLGAQLSSQPNSHIHTWPLEKP